MWEAFAPVGIRRLVLIMSSVIAYGDIIGRTAYTVGKVAQCTVHLLCLFSGEATLTTIAVDTVHLMVEPRRGTPEIGIGKLAPRNSHKDIAETLLHVTHSVLLLLVDYDFHIC